MASTVPLPFTLCLSLAYVRSALTIGYGDLVPTNTWGKILVFPFFILTISQLANEVLIIFGFIKDRADQRRNQWRKRYEAAMYAEANTARPKASILQEMALIQEINKREEMFVRPSSASLNHASE
jgi:potassium channel subfamily K